MRIRNFDKSLNLPNLTKPMMPEMSSNLKQSNSIDDIFTNVRIDNLGKILQLKLQNKIWSMKILAKKSFSPSNFFDAMKKLKSSVEEESRNLKLLKVFAILVTSQTSRADKIKLIEQSKNASRCVCECVCARPGVSSCMCVCECVCVCIWMRESEREIKLLWRFKRYFPLGREEAWFRKKTFAIFCPRH